MSQYNEYIVMTKADRSFKVIRWNQDLWLRHCIRSNPDYRIKHSTRDTEWSGISHQTNPWRVKYSNSFVLLEDVFLIFIYFSYATWYCGNFKYMIAKVWNIWNASHWLIGRVSTFNRFVNPVIHVEISLQTATVRTKGLKNSRFKKMH